MTDQAISERDKYTEYSYIWKESRKTFMFYFLQFSRVLVGEELQRFEEAADLLKKNPPSLDLFREKINFYEDLYKEVLKLEEIKIYNKWFRVDQRPFRTTLLLEIKRWSWIFKKHLLDTVVDSLEEMSDFIKFSDKELGEEVAEGDYVTLIRVMRVLLRVREKQSSYDQIFEPLQQKINLLKEFDVEIPEQSLVYMEKLGDKWSSTKRMAVTCKQSVSSMLGHEVGKLSQKISDYTVRQNKFRETYQGKTMFNYKCEHPYHQLAHCQQTIKALLTENKELTSQAELFEIESADFSVIEKCKVENQLLKQVCLRL